MKLFTNFLKVLLLSLILIMSQCKKNQPTQPKNQPPKIENISSSPNTSSYDRLPYGGMVNLTVVATDPDRDELTYSWKAESGFFPKGTSSSSVVWQAPKDVYTDSKYTIKVTVSDGALTDEGKIYIYTKAPKAGINAYPTSLDFNNDVNELKLKIFNIGEGILGWKVKNSYSWIHFTPSSGTLEKNTDTAKVEVKVDFNELDYGTFSQYFKIYNVNDNNDKVEIKINVEKLELTNVEGFVYYANTTIPISGVTVSINKVKYTTDSNGYYKLENVPVGTHTIKAKKDGYDSYSRDIQVSSYQNEFNIELTSAAYTHNLFGQITSSKDGRALQGVEVIVLNPDETKSNLRTYSDYNGFYQIPTVPQGTRDIVFGKRNYDSLKVRLFISNSDYKYDAQLKPTNYRISGEIWGDTTFYEYHSPYYIVGETKIKNGTLYIEPGVTVIFQSRKFEGEIEAKGSEEKPINFNFDVVDEENIELWGEFNYVNFNDINKAFLLGQGTLQNVIFNNCKEGLICKYSLEMRKCDLSRISGYAIKSGQNGGTFEIYDCNFNSSSIMIGDEDHRVHYGVILDKCNFISSNFSFYSYRDIKIEKCDFTKGNITISTNGKVRISDNYFDNNSNCPLEIKGFIESSRYRYADVKIAQSNFNNNNTGIKLWNVYPFEADSCNFLNNQIGLNIGFSYPFDVSINYNIHYCNIYGNNNYDIYVESDLFIYTNCEYNWWGYGNNPNLYNNNGNGLWYIDPKLESEFEDAGPTWKR